MDKKMHNEKPEVYALRQDAGNWQISRRSFLKAAGIGAAAVGFAVQGGFVKPASAEGSLEELCSEAPAHSAAITDLKISPDGSYLFSADGNGKIKCWDMESHSLLHSSEDPDKAESFECVGTIDGEPVVFKAGSNGSVRAIELPELKAYPDKFDISDDFGSIAALCASPDGDLYGIAANGLIHLLQGDGWPYFTEQELIFRSVGRLKDLAYLEQSSGLFVLLSKGFGVFSLDEGEIRVLESENEYRSFAVTPDEGSVLLNNDGAMYCLILLEDGTEIWKQYLGENILSAAVTPDGNCGILLCRDKTIRMIAMEDGRIINRLEAADTLLDRIVIAPDGSQCAVAVGKSILFLSLPDMKILGCPVDLGEMKDNSKGIKVTGTDSVTGETITYTLPCGAPIPAGAVCTCNCVAGSVCSCVGHQTCSCVGHTTTYTYHYWHPN